MIHYLSKTDFDCSNLLFVCLKYRKPKRFCEIQHRSGMASEYGKRE